MAEDKLEKLRGEDVALETTLAAALGEIAVLRASIVGGGLDGALASMEGMAAHLEGSVLHCIVGAEKLGRSAAASGFERWMEQTAHALRNAIVFRQRCWLLAIRLSALWLSCKVEDRLGRQDSHAT